jgi:teichuronic acid biosynthesis glycosyltransferase TuaG
MVNPLVSIVVPLFNKEEFIIQSLKSIVAQTYTNWECIIVDDGSTDSSCALVKAYFSTYNFNYTLLSQSNLGPSSARNLGIKNSKGKYVALLDADDIWMPLKLEKQVAYMEINPDVMLCLSNYLIFNDLNPNQLKAVRSKNPLTQIKGWLDMRGFGGLVESTGLFRRQCMTDELLFDPNLRTTEGLDFTLKWYLGGRIEILKQTLTLYRISSNQLHTNTDLIMKNVASMSLRYPFLVRDKKALDAFHRAYFELSALRNSRILRKLLTLLIRFGKADVYFFKMLHSIFLRNFRSKFISLSLRKQVAEFLEILKN